MFLISKSLENLTFFKEDNPSKANEETLQLLSKMISSIFLQLWNAHSPMLVILLGIVSVLGVTCFPINVILLSS